MRMNIEERKNLTFRLVSAFMILLDLGFDAYVASYLFVTPSQNQIVSIVACLFAAVMMIFEIIIILRGWKKESAMYKIAFNPNGRVNNVPLIAVSIFCAFGVGLIIMGSLLNVMKHVEPNVSSSLSILVIAVYLVTNCLIYYFYCLMFKKREVKLEDLIK